MPVPLLKKIMTSRDISEAMAYEKVEPFSRTRIDYWCKSIMALLVNLNTTRANAVTASKFSPPWEKQRKAETLTDKVKSMFGVPNKED